MSGDKTAREAVFIDTNILVYLISSEPSKAGISEQILDAEDLERIISTQVIGEFVNAARRKTIRSWDNIRESVDAFRAACRVELITGDIQDRALDLARSAKFRWYDAQIVASALAAGAQRLLTEDMQHGQVVEGLEIVNPFRDQ